jgi:hypothetical protein
MLVEKLLYFGTNPEGKVVIFWDRGSTSPPTSSSQLITTISHLISPLTFSSHLILFYLSPSLLSHLTSFCFIFLLNLRLTPKVLIFSVGWSM